MHSVTLRVSVALAVVVMAAGADAQMPTTMSTASAGWNTQRWPAPQATPRRLPRCEEERSARGPMLLTSVSTAPFATTQTVGYQGPVDLCADGKCATKGKDCKTCCPPAWAHRCGVFGEYLLLRPRDAEVAYGVPINGPIGGAPAPPIQVGPVGIVDPDYSSGFRAGFTYAFDWCSSVVVTYSHFESNTSNAIATEPNEVIRPLVTHPSTFAADSDALAASAGLGIDYDLIDADYRSIWWLGDCSVVNWSVGARYARLQQDFDALYTLNTRDENVSTDIGFEGGGIRLGLDAERHHCCGFLLYGKSSLSLVAGEFSATYFQGDQTQDQEVVNTSWKAGRIVPIMDLELGVGWQSPCGHYRLTGGYNMSYWFNSVTTDQWVKSVKENDFVGQADGMSYDTITFDGVTVRAEYRF